jgi:oligopeptidase A
MSSHPFLSLIENPAWENLTPEHIREDITLALEKSEANLQQIRDLKQEEINFHNTVKALENASYELYYAWGLVTHLDSVCNSDELREVHNEMLPAVSAFGAKITLDAKLWKALQLFEEKNESSSLSPIDQRLLEETLLDFKEAGADLPEEKRNRLEEISKELAQITQKFSEQVLDATNEWKIVVRDEGRLKGLPETARETARQTAIEKLGEEEGKDAWVFTLHAPSMLPVCNI